MKIEVPLYYNWYERGVLDIFPNVEWRRIPPGYYHNIKLQFQYQGQSVARVVMYWFNLPAKTYNVDGPSPPLPIFSIESHETIHHIHHFAIGDQVNEDSWIGFTLYGSQDPDCAFRVWAEIEQDHKILNLEQGYSSSPPRGLR
jgi:hypothetical protein